MAQSQRTGSGGSPVGGIVGVTVAILGVLAGVALWTRHLKLASVPDGPGQPDPAQLASVPDGPGHPDPAQPDPGEAG